VRYLFLEWRFLFINRIIAITIRDMPIARPINKDSPVFSRRLPDCVTV